MAPTTKVRTVLDWLLQFMAGVILVAGVAVAAVTVLVVPAYQWDDPYAKFSVEMDYDRSALSLGTMFPSDVALPRGTDLALDDTSVVLTYPRPSRELLLLSLLPAAVVGVCALVTSWLLFGLLKDIGGGQPFSQASIRRLIALTLVIPGGVIAHDTLVSISAANALDSLGLQGGPLVPPPIHLLAPLSLAFLLMALTTAFRRGRELQDDVAGMV
jgi:hypothetical protein